MINCEYPAKQAAELLGKRNGFASTVNIDGATNTVKKSSYFKSNNDISYASMTPKSSMQQARHMNTTINASSSSSSNRNSSTIRLNNIPIPIGFLNGLHTNASSNPTPTTMSNSMNRSHHGYMDLSISTASKSRASKNEASQSDESSVYGDSDINSSDSSGTSDDVDYSIRKIADDSMVKKVYTLPKSSSHSVSVSPQNKIPVLQQNHRCSIVRSALIQSASQNTPKESETLLRNNLANLRLNNNNKENYEENSSKTTFKAWVIKKNNALRWPGAIRWTGKISSGNVVSFHRITPLYKKEELPNYPEIHHISREIVLNKILEVYNRITPYFY